MEGGQGKALISTKILVINSFESALLLSPTRVGAYVGRQQGCYRSPIGSRDRAAVPNKLRFSDLAFIAQKKRRFISFEQSVVFAQLIPNIAVRKWR
jgi:hypothetical protein